YTTLFRSLAEQADSSRLGPRRQSQQSQQRGLARPRRSGKEVERAVWQTKVNVPQHGGSAPIAEAHASEADGVRRGIRVGGAADRIGHRVSYWTGALRRDRRGR